MSFAFWLIGLFVSPPYAAAAPPAAPSGPTLTLAQAVEKALANQPTLRQARANTDAAEGRVEQARSGLLPQVTATGSYQRTTANVSPRPGFSAVTTPPPWSLSTSYNFFNFGVNASQLIYDFGQTEGRKEAAESTREANRATEQTTEVQIAFNVSRAYYQALAQQELVMVGRDSVANQEKHVAQIEGLVKAGIRPDIDLASVRTTLANAKVGLITAENGLAIARATLDQTIGARVAGFQLVDEPAPPVPGEGDSPEAIDGLVKTALSNRPELVSLSRARKAQESSIEGIKGSYAPALGATAGATETGTGLDKLVPNWVVGATLTWPLFQGGLTRGQLHEARAVLSGIDAQVETLRLQVRVDVEQAQLAVRGAQASGAAAEEALVNAKDQLRLAEGRYSNGLGSVIELDDAQLALTNAAALSVSARYNLATARAQLRSALGRR